MFITTYQILYSYRLKEITDKMDSIGKKIMENDLGGKDFFKQEYVKNAKFLSIFTRCSMTSIFTTPFSYFLSVPVVEWFEGNYREHLPLPLANVFDDRQPVVYEIVVIVLSAGISIATAKKAALDSLFISFLSIQTTFLKYLSVAKDEMSKEVRFADDGRSRRKLLTWVKLHQEVIKNIEELVEYFSPIVVVYYIVVIEIVVCGAFVELKKDNDSIVQSISVGSYVMLTVIFYYLLSNKADELTTEVQKMVAAEYNLPWYAMKKSEVSIIKVVLMMCNKPIHITAYQAPVLRLNRETFSQFIVRAISALVTFFQMKDIFG
ncbi:odorant receptor 43a [Halyomorpha halys]|uniref:odorant receptor 43a n=1 Tax=Halyomorpha halys TaxID=286706 RepID=UPI0006D501AD